MMLQTEHNENTVTEKLRAGSRILSAVFAAGGVISIIYGIWKTVSMLSECIKYHDRFLARQNAMYILPTIFRMWFLGAMLLIAAWMFRRISQSGVPFDEKSVRAVRMIGILCILHAPVSIFATCLIVLEVPLLFPLAEIFPLHTIAEGMLFLFAAKLMHYGTALQQESDETL